MKRKTVLLVISPRLGDKISKLADMIGVFSAAGWKTDVALKEFGGHTLELAKGGAEAGYDLVIACGGDGTLNQVVNGVMAAKERHSIVGVIPGGTTNVWAHEIGVPEDPVAASLSLVNSETRKVDLGHVEVESLTIPFENKDRDKAVRPAVGGVHHFLLMAGLGIDAAVMRRVSKPLKEKLGATAAAIPVIEELVTQDAFPIEIRSSGGGREKAPLWKGEARQVIVSNTRRYGNIGEATPDAYIDDGVLDVLVITAGSPLTTMQQILAFVVHHKPSTEGFEHFQAAHLWITAPASVSMQLDGSAVKLETSLDTLDWAAVKEAGNPQAVMVTYRFDAMPGALRLAIPYTYDDVLFEEGASKDKTRVAEHQMQDQDAARVQPEAARKNNGHVPSEITGLLEKGQKVTVVGVAPNPERRGAYIVAGGAREEGTGETKPVAVRINGKTMFFRRTGEQVSPGVAAELREGKEIIVEGKESKRGVVRAKRIVVD
jgi:YegS/Rv2252/BmrU family lipid kinase